MQIPSFPRRPPGLPEGVQGAADALSRIATLIGQQSGVVRSVTTKLVGIETWESTAAERFAVSSRLHSDGLRTMAEGLTRSAQAMRAYASELGAAQAQWDRAYQAYEAQVVQVQQAGRLGAGPDFESFDPFHIQDAMAADEAANAAANRLSHALQVSADGIVSGSGKALGLGGGKTLEAIAGATLSAPSALRGALPRALKEAGLTMDGSLDGTLKGAGGAFMIVGGALIFKDEYDRTSNVGYSLESAGVQTAGGWAGAEAGALVGAEAGSFAAPGVGTLIGGFIGAAAGGIIGSDLAGGLFHKIWPG